MSVRAVDDCVSLACRFVAWSNLMLWKLRTTRKWSTGLTYLYLVLIPTVSDENLSLILLTHVGVDKGLDGVGHCFPMLAVYVRVIKH